MDPSLTYSVWKARPERVAGTPSGPSRAQLATIAITIVLLAWAGSLVYSRWVDPRMGADAAGRALTAKLRNGGIYACHRVEKDLTLGFMDDVDYACNAVNKPILSGYWIGTDSDSITEIEPSG